MSATSGLESRTSPGLFVRALDQGVDRRGRAGIGLGGQPGDDGSDVEPLSLGRMSDEEVDQSATQHFLSDAQPVRVFDAQRFFNERGLRAATGSAQDVARTLGI